MQMICPKHKECDRSHKAWNELTAGHYGRCKPHKKTGTCASDGYSHNETCPPCIPYEKDEMPDKPKYNETTRSRQLSTFYMDISRSKCKELFEQFGDMLWFLKPLYLSDVVPFDKMLEWAEQDPRRIKWLIEKGYIEEVQSEYDKWENDMPAINQHDNATKSRFVEWAKCMPRD